MSTTVYRRRNEPTGRIRREPVNAEYHHRPAPGSPRERRLRRERLRRKRRRRRLILVGIGILLTLEFVGLIALLRSVIGAGNHAEEETAAAALPTETAAAEREIQGIPESVFNAHPDWTEDFLTPNEYSRPGDPLEEVTSVFVHYTANQNTSAAQNRSYFEQLGETHERSASAHFIIGYNGEIIQCIPLDEIAYAVQTRNMDSVSIECCYTSSDGSFTQETYDSLVELLAWLTDAYDLDSDDILRHYDCGGKKCPLYYVNNPDAWERLKQDVEVKYM